MSAKERKKSPWKNAETRECRECVKTSCSDECLFARPDAPFQAGLMAGEASTLEHWAEVWKGNGLSKVWLSIFILKVVNLSYVLELNFPEYINLFPLLWVLAGVVHMTWCTQPTHIFRGTRNDSVNPFLDKEMYIFSIFFIHTYLLKQESAWKYIYISCKWLNAWKFVNGQDTLETLLYVRNTISSQCRSWSHAYDNRYMFVPMFPFRSACHGRKPQEA